MDVNQIFNPDKVAVVGASREEGKTGHEIFDNLLHDFEGEVVPVNPNAEEIHGLKAKDEVPEDTDMAVVAVPARIVPGVIRDLGKKDIGAAIVISAGFSESGNEELEEKVKRMAKGKDIALLGPNVLGVLNTENSMNASFASELPEEGGMSFMSQSGAFCTAILDYSKAEHLGFKHFVSLGNKAVINETDLLKYWRNTDTDTILGYTEGINDGRKFMKEAEKTSKETPIVMVKSGRTEKGGEAASSHTGSIAGSYQAYKAAFRKAGVIEAESNRDLLDYGRTLSSQPLPDGENIAVITNAGGPGVVTADEIEEHGLNLTKFENTTVEKLREKLPEEAATENPVDVIGDAGHQRYKDALETVLEDENTDTAIVLLTPQSNTEIEKTAKTIAKISENSSKPVLSCFIGEKQVKKGIEILEKQGVPEFEDPKDAVKTLKSVLDYTRFLDTERNYRELDVDVQKAKELLEDVESFENKIDLLKTYGFETPMTELAEAPKFAVEASGDIGYPVVMKIESPDIHHKTDLDGVIGGVETREQVEENFHEIVDNVHHEKPGSEIEGIVVQEEVKGIEVALGMKRDPQFGPMVMVGLGGIYIEALNDVSFGIAPISEEEAERMVHELRSHEIFEGSRGREEIVEPVKDAIIRMGELGLNHPEIKSVDINPLIVNDDDGLVADIEIETQED